jgi:hypothetical protein
MKVTNMISSRGNAVPNQFVIEGHKHYGDANNPPMITKRYRAFQSYDSTIVAIEGDDVLLDAHYWDYSRTTSKYRNQFLGETKKETQAKIDSGEYILTILN